MKTQVNDFELIQSYMLGKDEAIGILFNRYHSLFMTTSKKYFCNRQCAEDVVQDVLLKFLTYPIEKRIAIFSNVRSIKAFIYTTIRNMSFDVIRKKKLITTDFVDIDFLDDDESDVNYRLSIDYSLVGLSNNETLYFNDFIDELSLDAISKKYGVTKSTVKNTIQNAKKKVINFYQSNHLVA
jgi:RNA polymerase sigma factor (sigma-70 family)